jgi:hypothetical protein
MVKNVESAPIIMISALKERQEDEWNAQVW